MLRDFKKADKAILTCIHMPEYEESPLVPTPELTAKLTAKPVENHVQRETRVDKMVRSGNRQAAQEAA